MVRRKKNNEPAPSDDVAEDLDKGHFAYEGLNRVLHEKARLGILTALRTRNDGLLFGELKDLCSLTDGNLSRHLSVLQEAGLVEIVKSFRGAKPQTWAVLSKRGRKEFDAYIMELQRVIQDANIQDAPVSESKGQLPPGMAPA